MSWQNIPFSSLAEGNYQYVTHTHLPVIASPSHHHDAQSTCICINCAKKPHTHGMHALLYSNPVKQRFFYDRQSFWALSRSQLPTCQCMEFVLSWWGRYARIKLKVDASWDGFYACQFSGCIFTQENRPVIWDYSLIAMLCAGKNAVVKSYYPGRDAVYRLTHSCLAWIKAWNWRVWRMHAYMPCAHANYGLWFGSAHLSASPATISQFPWDIESSPARARRSRKPWWGKPISRMLVSALKRQYTR
jgi:hypothetical protein